MSACAKREGEDEEPAPRGEQRQVEVVEVELGSEEDLPDEGSERGAADDAEHADRDDDDHEVAHPGGNSSLRPAHEARELGSSAACTAWNKRIGIRDRNRPTMKSATADRWPEVARICAPRNGA